MHYYFVELFGCLTHSKNSDSRSQLEDCRCRHRHGVSFHLTFIYIEIFYSFNCRPKLGFPPTPIFATGASEMLYLPDDLVGVYDIVHIRFFVFVLQNDAVKGVLDNLFKSLSESSFPHSLRG